MHASIGHNYKAVHGPDLFDPAVSAVVPDDHKKLFHFAKWHIDDYLLGTEGMKLEHEGAYMRFLMRLYQRGKPLPDDDRYMSVLMRLSIRVWKRVKKELIEIGKIIVKCGCLTNCRFEKERKERSEQLRKQAAATRDHWAKRRAEKSENEKVSGKFDETFAKVSGKLSQNEREKINEINDVVNGQPDITRVLKKEEEEEDSVPNGTGAPAPDRSLREMAWDEGLSWIRGRTITNEARLRNRFGRWVKDYGPGAVLNAIGEAQKIDAVEPLSFIEGCLRRRDRVKIEDQGSDLKPWELEAQFADQCLTDCMDALEKKYANGYVPS